jgi:hypothetical protein
MWMALLEGIEHRSGSFWDTDVLQVEEKRSVEAAGKIAEQSEKERSQKEIENY